MRPYTPGPRSPKGMTRTKNPSIMSDGSVDPQSPMYQRGVAGRQKLEDFVKGLWDQGKSERDVFMAAVKSLTSRGHGYVGAYLDSKNPGRVYKDNEAKAIADAVMTKANIGNHPGARLSGASDEEEGKKIRDARTQRREASKYGPQMPVGKKAKSVRQQRKEGKREGLGAPETWPKEGQPFTSSPVEKPPREPKQKLPESGFDLKSLLDKRLNGEISTKELVDAYAKAKQSPIPGANKGGRPRKEKPAEEETTATTPATGGGGGAAPTPQEEPADEGDTKLIPIEGNVKKDLALEFKTNYDTFRKNLIAQERKNTKGAWDKNKEKYIQPDDGQFKDLIDLSIDNLADKYGNVDRDTAKSILRKVLTDQYGVDPYEGEQESASSPEPQKPTPPQKPAAPQESAPEPQEPSPKPQESTPPQESAPTSQPPAGKKPTDQGISSDLQSASRSARKSPGGGGFAGKKEVVDAGKDIVRNSTANSQSKEEFVKSVKEEFDQMGINYRNWKLNPNTYTADTNPLEGGSTPQPPPEKEPFTPSLGPGEEQGTLFRKDGSPRKWRTPKNTVPTEGQPAAAPETQKQINLPLSRPDSKTRVAQRASEIRAGKEESQKAKTEKQSQAAARKRQRADKSTQGELFTKTGRPRKFPSPGKFSTSENMKGMSYDEFSRSIRSLMR